MMPNVTIWSVFQNLVIFSHAGSHFVSVQQNFVSALLNYALMLGVNIYVYIDKRSFALIMCPHPEGYGYGLTG